jgi:hypothetical protein
LMGAEVLGLRSRGAAAGGAVVVEAMVVAREEVW